MTIRIANVVFDAPGATLEEYASAAGGVARMYAELLAMRLRSRAEVYREANYPADAGDEADPLVLSDDRSRPNIAFECENAAYRAPRWPDPEHPQQVHLDVTVSDLEAAHDLVVRHGATLLREADDHRTYSDRIGHPFCLYPDTSATPGRIARIVIDGPDPTALAEFYAELLDMPVRVVDTSDRVEIARQDRGQPTLAFQRVRHRRPRWPDPAHPQQLHLDLDPAEPDRARELAVRLGATRLEYLGGGIVYADPAGHPFCLGD